jgi:tetratricopeptide (TPR) repeat protein
MSKLAALKAARAAKTQAFIAPWSIGDRVRFALTGSRACVATITGANEVGTADVSCGTAEAEAGVTLDRLSKLQEFELLPASAAASHGVDALKDQGNVLFKLNDHGAAFARYKAALKLAEPVVSVGAAVLVRQPNGFFPAMVADLEGGRAEVMFEHDDSEEDGVETSRLVAMASAENAAAQRALYLNMARCKQQLGDHKVAQLYSTVAVVLCRLHVDRHESGQQRQGAAGGGASGDGDAAAVAGAPAPAANAAAAQASLLKALYFRAQVQLSMHHFRHACADAERVLLLDPENKPAQRLRAKVEVQAQQSLKKDRKLAKDVAKWVEAATKDAEF